MSLACLFGLHRPSLGSIVRRPYGLAGLCDGCSRPLVKPEGGKWTLSEPLDNPIAS